MKKILTLLLVLCLAAGCLAGCGGGQPTVVMPNGMQTPGQSQTGGSGNEVPGTAAPGMSEPTTPTQQGTEEKPGQDAGNVPGGIPAAGYDGSPVTVTFYHTMGQSLSNVLDAHIAQFNKLYPNITIDHRQIGGYDDVRDQISTEISYGTQPNIAYCYPDHVALYNMSNAVVALDDLIESQTTVTRADGTTEVLGLTHEQKDDFIRGYYNEGKQFGDNLMYTLPMCKSTEVLYYDQTFFETHDLPVPTTWDQMEAVCAKIKEIDPESIPLGYDSEANWFITMCAQSGSPYTSATGDHYLFNNDTNKAFVKRFNNWYQKGYLTTQTLYGAYTSGLFTAQGGPRCYMTIASSAGTRHQLPETVNGQYRFEVGIAQIPQVDAANPKVISQGPSLCIFDKEDPQEVIASWLFVKFLTTNTRFQADFSMASGYTPVLQSVWSDPTYSSFLDRADGGLNVDALMALMFQEMQNACFTTPAFNGSALARDQVGNLMAKCLTFTGDVDAQINAAFAAAIEEM